MTRSRRRQWLVRTLIGVLAAAWLAVAVSGAVGYWNSYYVHRGFAPVKRVRHSGRGDNVRVSFYSHALGQEYDYRVFLPSHYDPRKYRYPVFYLLHGSPGRPQVFVAVADVGVRLDNMIAEHHAFPMILVFPDARIAGNTYSDSEWANTPAGAYESDVIDVVNDVDRRFSVIRSRDQRTIGGFSMGAYGAVNIALHHLSLFRFAQAWSGYFRQTRSGVFAHASAADLAYNSPAEEVGRLVDEIARYPLNVYMFVGRGDRDSRQIRPMNRALLDAGATSAYRIYTGGHDWELWNTHVDGMLAKASFDMGPPQRIRPVHGRRHLRRRVRRVRRVRVRQVRRHHRRDRHRRHGRRLHRRRRRARHR